MFAQTFGYQTTPRGLRLLLSTMAVLSLACALSLRLPFYIGANLQSLLAMSSWGLSHNFYWQLITHLFVQPISTEVTIFFLVGLFFNLLFLLFIGKALIYYKSMRDFLTLFFTAGILSALSAWALSSLTSIPMYLAGPSTPIYALLAVWTFFNPHQEMLFFLIIPIQVRYLLLILLGSSLFLDLANGNIYGFITCLTAVLTGYLFALIKYEIHSPYEFLHEFERRVIALKRKLARPEKVHVDIASSKSKVYDFKTGRLVLDDADFMDICLEKISRYGRGSLTIRERLRMFFVSRRLKSKV